MLTKMAKRCSARESIAACNTNAPFNQQFDDFELQFEFGG
jgi:hypothetical protein